MSKVVREFSSIPETSLSLITVDRSVLHQSQLLADVPPPRLLGGFNFAAVQGLATRLEGLEEHTGIEEAV